MSNEMVAETEGRVLDEFLRAVIEAAQAARKSMATAGGAGQRPGEDFLSMAVAAGLPVRGQYTVAEVSMATGIPKSTLYKAHRMGLIDWSVPAGFETGAMVRPAQVDEYLGASGHEA